MTSTKSPFASQEMVSRTFELTGRIRKIIRKTRFEWNILIVPTDAHSRMPAAGIWLTGHVPADRNPDYSVYAVLHCGWVYSFDVVATGNTQQIPSHEWRIDFEIMRVKYENKHTFGYCIGEFAITGKVIAVHSQFAIIKTDALPASQKRTALPSYFIPLHVNREIRSQLWEGRNICARVRVYPRTRDGKYVTHAQILELAMFMYPTLRGTVGDAQKSLEPGVKTFERRGYWRTGAHGAKYWVRPCIVHMKAR